MKHPPYHLRPNKAIDRLLLIDVLESLKSAGYDFSKYTYCTLGGPFLEDCKLVVQHLPRTKIISIERRSHTIKRQHFHLPSKRVELYEGDVDSYIDDMKNDFRCIFWLDYMDFDLKRLEEFERLLGKVSAGSVVKLTIPAEPPPGVENDDQQAADQFNEMFLRYLGAPLSLPEFRRTKFVGSILKIVQVAAQQALPASTGLTFQLVAATYYKDHTTMLSVVGVVCPVDKMGDVRVALAEFQCQNFNWSDPKHIDVPDLSVKERLKLDRLLPCDPASLDALQDELGYNIDNTGPSSRQKLDQYREFHRFYPLFARFIP